MLARPTLNARSPAVAPRKTSVPGGTLIAHAVTVPNAIQDKDGEEAAATSY